MGHVNKTGTANTYMGYRVLWNDHQMSGSHMRYKIAYHSAHWSILGAVSIRKTVLLGMAIPMLKIRRPTGRLIFNMGIPIPGKDGLYIETGPLSLKLALHIHGQPAVRCPWILSFLPVNDFQWLSTADSQRLGVAATMTVLDDSSGSCYLAAAGGIRGRCHRFFLHGDQYEQCETCSVLYAFSTAGTARLPLQKPHDHHSVHMEGQPDRTWR